MNVDFIKVYFSVYYDIGFSLYDMRDVDGIRQVHLVVGVIFSWNACIFVSSIMPY